MSLFLRWFYWNHQWLSGLKPWWFSPLGMNCTANVLTLYPGDRGCGNFVSARQEALMHQMHEEGIHFVGIQESRSGFDGYIDSEHYHTLSAPATQRGVGGVQLWIAKQFHFSHRTLRLVSQDLDLMLIPGEINSLGITHFMTSSSQGYVFMAVQIQLSMVTDASLFYDWI